MVVKRLLDMYHGSTDRKTFLLIESHVHLNIVWYFLKKVCEEFI